MYLQNSNNCICFSAGVGRTGTYIAIDILTQMADTKKAVDIFHCVKTLRDHRMNMVQTQVSRPTPSDIQISKS